MEWRTENFKQFVERKESDLDNVGNVVDQCERKLLFLEHAFGAGGDDVIDSNSVAGLTYILDDIRADLCLISDELTRKKGKQTPGKESTEGKEAV